MAAGGSGRNLMRLFDGHDVDEEQRFFHDGSQVGSYSPPAGRVPTLRLGGPGFLTPAHGGVAPAATALLPPHPGAFSAPAPLPFVDPPAPEGFDLNSQAAGSFPGLDEYERVLVADEAPPRRRSGKHVVATQGRLRGSIGRGSTASAGVPPRPARSGVGRGGGGGSRGRGGARARSVGNAARAHSGSHIHLETDEDGGYRTMSMEADASHMLLNSDEDEDNSDERGFDTAKWNDERLELYLQLVVREISAGNRPNNQMSPVGWKNICKDFRRTCGQNYNLKAMNNRYTQAKVLATFWKEVQVKSSGLGRGPNGEILASESWWQANTKGRTECYKVFRDRVPPYLDDLMLIFDHMTVDGSSAFCPGYEEAENEPSGGVRLGGDHYDLTQEDDQFSPTHYGLNHPTSSSASKRPYSTATTRESPSKKTKSPMVKALRGLVNEIKIEREEGKKKGDTYAKREEARSKTIVAAQAEIMENKRQAIQAEMDECVALAKQSGVAENSIEMWVASELFMEANKRAFFRSMETNQGRIGWIQMHCKQRGLL